MSISQKEWLIFFLMFVVVLFACIKSKRFSLVRYCLLGAAGVIVLINLTDMVWRMT